MLTPSAMSPGGGGGELDSTRPGSAAHYARRLRLLDESREELLAEGEYEELRAATLAELTAGAGLLRQGAPIWGACALVSLGVAGLGFFGNTTGFLFGGLFALVGSTVAIRLVMREERQIGRLAEAEHLLVVDSLLGWGLVSEEEAAELRSAIHRSGRAIGPSV